MITILQGRFSHRDEIDVPSGRIDLRPPKIIVGVSLNSISEGGSFPQNLPTFPAILDTGFNRTFEIDESHLVRWAGLRTEHLAKAPKELSQEGRKYTLCQANIWLHRTPYEKPDTPRVRLPLLLKNSLQVRVMNSIGKPNPRLPLLGVTAVIRNHLKVAIDGDNSQFRVYRSLRMSLTEWYREFFNE